MTEGYPNPHSMTAMLPGIYASDELAVRLVGSFDEVLSPVLLSLDNLACYLDPRLAPEDFLTWLGSWVTAVDHPDLPLESRRRLVRHAVELHARRGTRAGLAWLLELCTGDRVTVYDPGGIVSSPTPGAAAPGAPGEAVVVHVPATVDSRLVDALVAAHRPAQLGYRVEVGAAP